jgi:uncharacterized protein GlcG (DUF336 family)/sugar lactone lactonase YvrE
MRKITIVMLIVCAWTLFALGLVSAQNGSTPADAGTTVAEGLNGPMAVLIDENGDLWVIDSGMGGGDEIAWLTHQGEEIVARFGESARIIRVSLDDGAQEVIAMLPSLDVGMETIGGTSLTILDGELYAAIGLGIIADEVNIPPLMGSIVHVQADGMITQVADVAGFELAENPDPAIHDTNPYGLAAGPDGYLYLADAGGNTLLRIDPDTGGIEAVAVFEPIPGLFPRPERGGALVTDPVPTGIVIGEDGNYYVSFLSGVPFIPGSAKVVQVTPDGEVSDYATGLTMLTDLKMGPDGELYAVQFGMFTEQGPAPNSGAVIRIHEGDASETVVEGLSFATSIGFDTAGNAYVTINGLGAPGSGAVVRFDGLAGEAATEDEDDSAATEDAQEEGCAALPRHDALTAALVDVVVAADSGGFGFNMWATLVDRDGVVCAVTFSGEDRGDQFPGSRVISAQKANTANGFSLPNLALSTANLYTAVQPGGSLYGLQFSNPVYPVVAYAGPASAWGQEDDPMVGHRIGGVNVFGGGLALYGEEGRLLGALGISGDTSCTDHIVAWKVRDALGLDQIPGGVSDTGDDNILFDADHSFGHPECGLGEVEIAAELPEVYPLGSND